MPLPPRRKLPAAGTPCDTVDIRSITVVVDKKRCPKVSTFGTVDLSSASRRAIEDHGRAVYRDILDGLPKPIKKKAEEDEETFRLEDVPGSKATKLFLMFCDCYIFRAADGKALHDAFRRTEQNGFDVELHITTKKNGRGKAATARTDYSKQFTGNVNLQASIMSCAVMPSCISLAILDAMGAGFFWAKGHQGVLPWAPAADQVLKQLLKNANFTNAVSDEGLHKIIVFMAMADCAREARSSATAQATKGMKADGKVKSALMDKANRYGQDIRARLRNAYVTDLIFHAVDVEDEMLEPDQPQGAGAAGGEGEEGVMTDDQHSAEEEGEGSEAREEAPDGDPELSNMAKEGNDDKAEEGDDADDSGIFRAEYRAMENKAMELGVTKEGRMPLTHEMVKKMCTQYPQEMLEMTRSWIQDVSAKVLEYGPALGYTQNSVSDLPHPQTAYKRPHHDPDLAAKGAKIAPITPANIMGWECRPDLPAIFESDLHFATSVLQEIAWVMAEADMSHLCDVTEDKLHQAVLGCPLDGGDVDSDDQQDDEDTDDHDGVQPVKCSDCVNPRIRDWFEHGAQTWIPTAGHAGAQQAPGPRKYPQVQESYDFDSDLERDFGPHTNPAAATFNSDSAPPHAYQPIAPCGGAHRPYVPPNVFFDRDGPAPLPSLLPGASTSDMGAANMPSRLSAPAVPLPAHPVPGHKMNDSFISDLIARFSKHIASNPGAAQVAAAAGITLSPAPQYACAVTNSSMASTGLKPRSSAGNTPAVGDHVGYQSQRHLTDPVTEQTMPGQSYATIPDRTNLNNMFTTMPHGKSNQGETRDTASSPSKAISDTAPTIYPKKPLNRAQRRIAEGTVSIPNAALDPEKENMAVAPAMKNERTTTAGKEDEQVDAHAAKRQKVAKRAASTDSKPASKQASLQAMNTNAMSSGGNVAAKRVLATKQAPTASTAAQNATPGSIKAKVAAASKAKPKTRKRAGTARQTKK